MVSCVTEFEVPFSRVALIFPGEGGRYSTKVRMGRLRFEIQVVTRLYTILTENVPRSYTFQWKKVPLHIDKTGKRATAEFNTNKNISH